MQIDQGFSLDKLLEMWYTGNFEPGAHARGSPNEKAQRKSVRPFLKEGLEGYKMMSVPSGIRTRNHLIKSQVRYHCAMGTGRL